MESAGQLLLSAPPLQLASANMILPNSNNWQKQQEQNPILQQQQHIDRSMDQIIIDVDGSTNSQDEFTITEDASDVKLVTGEQASSADTNVLNQEQRKCPARLTTENQQEKSIKCEQEMDEEMDEAKVGQNPVMVETSGSQSDANQPQNAASIGASGKPLPVIKPPGDEKEDRPTLSYKDLIIEAIESSAECRLKLSEIYQVIKYLHPYYQRRSDQWGWQNSIRHNLSLHDCFVKLPLKQTSANGVVGHFWTVIHRSPEDKQGPTRRRSRANGGGTTGKGKKAMALAQQQHQDQRDAKEGKRGIKGRHTQSVCSDSGFVSDGFDGEFDASQEITMRERLGSASAPPRPRPVLLTASTGDHQKFQSLQSPLALKGLHFLNQQQQQVAPIPQQHAQNNLLSPLELVMNGQPHSLQSPQPQLLPASTHFSPIPGKTAPAILEQLLAMSNFATHQQSQIPNQSHPCTPISAPPTLMPVQPLSTSNSAFVDGGLNLLSQLASHALATASPAQHPHNNNPLAVAAATELQRLQLLQLCAQQQQLQLQQQLALLEQSHREQQQQQQHSFQLTGGHSAPLSPAHEQLQPSSSIIGDNQSGALLTQLLLSHLINASTATGNIQQLHQPQQQQQPNSPPLSMSASLAVVNSPAISLFAHRQQQSELQQAVLLLQQQQQQTILLEQHQQVEVAQLLTSQLAVAAATQQQHQDSTPSSSEPELAVV